tara:strand:+ start:133 stop:474 length:342 start_codon:yes stop_codon:yes gene_type:complete
MKEMINPQIWEGHQVPSEVYVAGIRVKVTVDGSMKKLHGCFMFDKREIVLAEGHGEDAWRTLWHEMAHAAFAFSGFGCMLAIYEEDLEEAFMTMWDNIGLPAILESIPALPPS